VAGCKELKSKVSKCLPQNTFMRGKNMVKVLLTNCEAYKAIEKTMRKIVFKHLDQIYRDTIIADLKPSEKMKMGVNDLIEDIAKEFGIQERVVVNMLIWTWAIKEYKLERTIQHELSKNKDYLKNNKELEKINIAIKKKN